MLITPVALIIFNRADLTEKVFAAIRRAKPAKLYIIADGPRNAGEKVLTDAARAATENIDWVCEPVRLYSTEHLGCRERVLTGLNRVFEQEKSAIMLEDDCLPQKDFFEYCETLLHHYEADDRIGAIQGASLPGFAGNDGQNSCVFTRLGIMRGWATWQKVWKEVDLNLSNWNPSISVPRLNEAFPGQEDLISGLSALFEKAQKKDCNDWTPAFLFSLLEKGLFHIHPADNLVTHIGSGKLATHSHLMQSDTGLPAGPGWNHHHRALVQHDSAADATIFKTLYQHAIMHEKSHSLVEKLWDMVTGK